MCQRSWTLLHALDLLKDYHLIPSILKVRPSCHELAKEIVWNLSSWFGDETSEDYGVVFVRQDKIMITPEKINDCVNMPVRISRIWGAVETNLDQVATIITGGKITEWDGNLAIKSSITTTSYAILHMFCVSDMIATTLK